MTGFNSFFQAEDIELVERVFMRVLSNGSFARTNENEQELARFVAHCFQNGLVDEEGLMTVVSSTALIKWSKPQELMDWPIKSSLAEDG